MNLEEVEARARQSVLDDRRAFASDADALLGEVRQYVSTLSDQIGDEATREEAYRRLCRRFLDLLYARLPQHNLEAILLREVLEYGCALARNPHATMAERQEWARSAEFMIRS